MMKPHTGLDVPVEMFQWGNARGGNCTLARAASGPSVAVHKNVFGGILINVCSDKRVDVYGVDVLSGFRTQLKIAISEQLL